MLKIFTGWTSWFFALLSVLFLSYEIILRTPDVEIGKVPYFVENDIIEKAIESCCISTIFDSHSIRQAVVLGHSLNHLGSKPPKMFAFFLDNITEHNLSEVSKYFSVINGYNHGLKYSELLHWSLKECNPVIAVSKNGAFYKEPTKICNSKPFSSVSQRGDIVFFDPSLMVLNPTDNIDASKEEGSFKRFINDRYPEWNPLPSDLSVEDYDNDFLDFWCKFSSPTYVHFNDDTFNRAIKGNSAGTGSKALYLLIKRMINDAQIDHNQTLV